MTIRMRVLPRFPARIYGRDGFIVLRDDSDLVIGPDYGSLVTTPALVDLTTKFFQVYNADDNSYIGISAQNLADEIQGFLVDGTLAAIGMLSPGENESIYFLDGGIAATYTITQAGRDLVAGINAESQRITLGLGALATKSTINDADWSGADLSIPNGGTGASTAAAARTNLGLGTAATQDSTAFATSTQGGKADTAIQPGDNRLVPAGGTTGQVLAKSSNSDNEDEWVTIAAAAAVSYAPQTLSGPEQAQARSNISAQQSDQILTNIAALTTAQGQFLQFLGPDSVVARPIVGPVAQASGVPTASIVETGSNGNGTYTKFADGTMICTGSLSSPLTTSSSVGAVFTNPTAVAFTFPATFVGNPPHVSPFAARNVDVASGLTWATASSAFVTTTSATQIFLVGHAATCTGRVSYVAQGRWF